MIKKAMKLAEKKISESADNFKITDIYDLGDSWLFCWDSKDETEVLSDNLSIEIEKQSLKCKRFVLPDERNFQRLEKAKKVNYANQRQNS